MFYALDSHFYSFSFITTYVFLILQRYFFLVLIYANTFEIVHTCVCIKNANACEVLSNSLKYYTFVGNICSFTSMVSYIFLIW